MYLALQSLVWHKKTFAKTRVYDIIHLVAKNNAVVAELADAPSSGGGGQPCEFESHRPHHFFKPF